MTDLLAHLRVDEISAADDPANGTPGWMVAKARGAAADAVAKRDGFYAIAPGDDVKRTVAVTIKQGTPIEETVAAMLALGADVDVVKSLAGDAAYAAGQQMLADLRKEATSQPFEPEPVVLPNETAQQEAQRRFPLFTYHGGAPLPMLRDTADPS